MTNSLMLENILPPFKTISADDVQPAIDNLLDECRSGIQVILDSGENSWDGLIQARDELEDKLNQAWSPVSHMNSLVNSDDLRKVYNECLPKLSEYSTEMGQNLQLFQAYKELSESRQSKDLTIAQGKVIDNALREFRLSGIDLNVAEKQRFADISKQLAELSSRFSDNVLDANGAWSKLIVEAAELKGLPDNALALLKQTADQRGEDGYLLTLDMPSYLPVMTYCDNSELRQEVYEAFVTRASDQGPSAGKFDNSALMLDILKLRKEQAALLGFDNFAHLSLAMKMADNTDEVFTFLRELSNKSRSVAQGEFDELCKYALDKHGVAEVNPWDLSYFAEKLKKVKFDISDEELRPYFPAPKVTAGMFEVVRRLYDIEIKQVDDMETWHQDVKTYCIYKDGAPLARFYMDLYARTNKQGGAWMDECRVRRLKNDGSIQLPVAYLTCNFTEPLGDDPALLTHNEVVTLFHEFGHGLHHMMTQMDCAGVSGINGVAWDAVELPSQFMENWCWQREALQFISGHYKTDEPLPDELLDKMLAAKNFQSAMGMVRQLEFSLFDFQLHVEFDENAENQIQEILDSVRKDVAVVPAPSFNRFQHAFSHIFGGGYSAGYYSYKWAEVLSADAFGKFVEDGIFNRQTGEKFLSTVLEQGGSRDAMDLFVAFRGREPSVDALLRQEGIL
ncbi:MAG: oligopeptidase A [Pseudomonadales bacterium]